MICIKIKYGCGHLGVATFAIEILRMSEIALDPHLPIAIYLRMKLLRSNFHLRLKRAVLSFGALLFKQAKTG